MSLIIQSGPIGLLAVIMGAVGLCFAVAQLATGRDLQGAISWSAAIAFLLGLAGTGLGMLTAADAVVGLEDAARAARLWRQAQAIAGSTTTVGALAAIVDLVAMAAVTVLRPPKQA
jgi:hypothetical protein